jgi:hypothetical protein
MHSYVKNRDIHSLDGVYLHFLSVKTFVKIYTDVAAPVITDNKAIRIYVEGVNP